MAKVLIVDELPANREFLLMILGNRGHHVIEAPDGSVALTLARAELPDLIITDVLTPTMDGSELVQKLRLDPALAATPVVFSAPHFLAREAKALADQCSVSFILNKPCQADDVLRTVNLALGLPEASASQRYAAQSKGNHLSSLDDQPSQTLEELKAANEKLGVLMDLAQELTSEHGPLLVLEEYCRAARVVIGAKCGAVGLLSEEGQRPGLFFVCGVDDRTVEEIGYSPPDRGVLARVLGENRNCRIGNLGGDPKALGFPARFPAIYSLLGVPIGFQDRVYGWLCLTNKLGSLEFSAEDEQLATTVAAQMAVAYENAVSYGELQNHADELKQEVAELKGAEQERVKLLLRADEARERAEETNRLKDLFLATVSHELREPLNAILGWTRILRSREFDATTLAYAIETIERNIGLQVRLVGDLLDTARVEHGKLRLNLQSLDLEPLVRNTLDVVRPAAEAKGVQLLLSCDPGVTRINGDPERLQQIAWNLLSNAIKFTPAGGCVAVRLQKTETDALITVRDTGQGISSESLPRVFERLFQADETMSGAGAGLGLGLAMVRHLTELHGGTVEADSPGEGQGAVLTVKLPLRSAPDKQSLRRSSTARAQAQRGAGSQARKKKSARTA
jgi:signal transduction histidine kinase/DNA-binding response OmpR family regulator